jgi:hypothetical protein
MKEKREMEINIKKKKKVYINNNTNMKRNIDDRVRLSVIGLLYFIAGPRFPD